MDEIEVVIRIPEEWIEQFKAFKHPSTLETIILQGTVLPKGHGRLIDADKLKEDIRLWDDDYAEDGYDHIIEESDINDAPTVIEADREAEDD